LTLSCFAADFVFQTLKLLILDIYTKHTCCFISCIFMRVLFVGCFIVKLFWGVVECVELKETLYNNNNPFINSNTFVLGRMKFINALNWDLHYSNYLLMYVSECISICKALVNFIWLFLRFFLLKNRNYCFVEFESA